MKKEIADELEKLTENSCFEEPGTVTLDQI